MSDSPSDVAPEQGYHADASDPVVLRQAIEMAFDYRGDVTITRRSTPDPLVGYIFDRRVDDGALEGSTLRVLVPDGTRIELTYADVDRIEFSGRDTAAGRSFETWMKTYVRKKMAGERAEIQAEPLE